MSCVKVSWGQMRTVKIQTSRHTSPFTACRFSHIVFSEKGPCQTAYMRSLARAYAVCILIKVHFHGLVQMSILIETQRIEPRHGKRAVSSIAFTNSKGSGETAHLTLEVGQGLLLSKNSTCGLSTCKGSGMRMNDWRKVRRAFSRDVTQFMIALW